MKFVSRRGLIVGMILLLSISEINGAQIRRRRQASGGSKSSINWQSILDGIQKIPLIGGFLHKNLVDFGNMVKRVDDLTNGAVSRIAGGYPPCTVDLTGVHCNGKPKNGGIVGITTELVNSTMLPSVAKTMINEFLKAFVFPLFDVIVGIPVKKT